MKVGSMKVGSMKVGSMKVGPTEIDTREISLAEISARSNGMRQSVLDLDLDHFALLSGSCLVSIPIVLNSVARSILSR